MAFSRFPTTWPVPWERQILQPASSNPLCPPSSSLFCPMRRRSPHADTSRTEPASPPCKVQQLRQNHQQTGLNSSAGLCAEAQVSSFIHQTASGVKVSGRRGQQCVGMAAPLSSLRATPALPRLTSRQLRKPSPCTVHRGATACCPPAANVSPRADHFH